MIRRCGLISSYHHRMAVIALFMALTASGCAKTMQFSVLRPAKINVKRIAGDAEPTVSVGQWSSATSGDQQYASEVGQYLRELIVNSEGHAIAFAETGGAVTLNGTLQEHGQKEDVTVEDRTCAKGVGDKKVSYPCKFYTRAGKATVRISMNVLDTGGKTVAADTASLERAERTSATDEQPPAIDWEGILLGLRRDAAGQLAKSVVPYRVVVAKRMFSCGDAKKTCQAGMTQLGQGNFDEAIALFTQALESLEKSAKRDSENEAAAYWALALTHEFSGNFKEAGASVRKAIALDPDNETYASEVSAIAAEEKAQNELLNQGAKVAEL